jgi:hypothetical protein
VETMKALGRLVCAVGVLAASVAHAGTFDAQGNYAADPLAIAVESFDAPTRFLPEDADPKCSELAYSVWDTATRGDAAIDGERSLRLKVVAGCAERVVVDLPKEQASYRATLWMRHGSVSAQFLAIYPEDSGMTTMSAQMYPTGRTTSDGWIELTTNEFPVDGALATRTYVKLANYADDNGVDVDALEVVNAGSYVAQESCAGRADPVCGSERVCVFNQCQLGRLFLPPLPDASVRDEAVDVLAERLVTFFGGKRTRALFLPTALARIEGMRSAPTAYAFWSEWAIAIRELHDWHTSASSSIASVGTTHRLNACFFEGDGDASHATWPRDPRYADVLVSHAGALGAAGLHTGDRLVAIDGMHPLEWAASLVDVDWAYRVASDPNNFADHAERLGGPAWSGGALILRHAKSFTVIRCAAETGTCQPNVETIDVEALPNEPGGNDVLCDNRPFYHLEPGKNPGDNHSINWKFFRGRVAETTEDEAIYGMVWDTLYGGGDPNGYVNSNLIQANTDFKAMARGVILDHRAGNGGTLDAAENVTKLVRAEEPLAVVRMPMAIAADDGPTDLAEGQALFDDLKSGSSAFTVGSDDYDAQLPVALILHRDGSASDYMPFGMKGAPKVKIFAPHQTAGAFSTFINFTYWSGLSVQFASGDTIAFDGRALIGHGVEPDVVVWPRQSDLLAGKDSLHEAALAWVRKELKP